MHRLDRIDDADCVTTAWLRARAWKRVLRVAAPGASATVSSSVFQALQWGHWPSHWALLPPQSRQLQFVLALTVIVGAAGGADEWDTTCQQPAPGALGTQGPWDSNEVAQ